MRNKKNFVTGLIILILLSSGLIGCAARQDVLAGKSDQWVDSTDFSTFSEAVAAAAEKTLIIAFEKTLDKSIVVGQNTHLMFLKGGKIVKAADYTLRIDGAITAPMFEIFSNFKPGDVTFGKRLDWKTFGMPAVTIGKARVDKVNPLWWGAKDDASSDASQAIQCALDSGPDIYIPKGRYLLNKPLNCTQRTSLSIRGGGASEGKGTALIGNTGNVVLDLTGSRQIDLSDFDIVVGERFGTMSAEPNPSTIGILYARTEKTQFVEFNTLSNVGVHLDSVPTANNNNGSVAIYNFAAEHWAGHDLYLEADNSIVFTGYNMMNISSPFQKMFTKYPSMAVCVIDGLSVLRSRKGACLTLDNASRIDISSTYFSGDGAMKDPFPYAVKVTGPGFYSYAVSITAHLERAGGWLYTDVNLRGLTLRGTGSGSGGIQVYISPNSTIGSGEISIDPLVEREMPLIYAPEQGSFYNMVMYLFGKQKIVAPNMAFTGNTIYTYQSLADAKAMIEVGSASSYQIMAKDGISNEGKD